MHSACFIILTICMFICKRDKYNKRSYQQVIVKHADSFVTGPFCLFILMLYFGYMCAIAHLKVIIDHM